MGLTILLTSYNRPALVTRAIESIKAQTCDDWQLIVLDDNSNEETKAAIIEAMADHENISTLWYPTSEGERSASVRYATLINSIMPQIDDGIIGYLCDNVEYQPDLVERVLRWFDSNPDKHIGYVAQSRDVFEDGRFVDVAMYGHWRTMPQMPGATIIPQYIRGNLDHSQVFHRMPTKQRWSMDPKHVKYGDAEFYTRLAYELGDIECIWPLPLTLEHIPK